MNQSDFYNLTQESNSIFPQLNASDDKQDLLQHLQDIYKKLEYKTRTLSTLYQMSEIVTSEYDVSRLISLTIESLKNLFSVAVGSVMLLDKNTSELTIEAAIGIDEQIKRQARVKLGQGISGWVAQTGEPLFVKNIEEHEQFSRRNQDQYPTKSFFSIPLKAKNRVIGVINLSNDSLPEDMVEDELQLLLIFAGQVAVAIENANLYERLIGEQRLRDELEIATEIQKSILPKSFPEVEGIDMAAMSSPAKEIGGDFYDYFKIGKHKIGIVIGDVSGKSIPAALVMTISRDIIHAEAVTNKLIKKAIAKSNNLIAEESLFGMFVTVFYAVLNAREKTLEYISAGHLRQIVYHPAKDKVKFLKAKGKPLGIFKIFPPMGKRIVNLYPGDIILLFTDGIIEAINENQQEFGEERLLKIVKNNAHLCAKEMIEVIEQERKAFCGRTPQFDDLAMVVIKMKGEE